MRLLAYNIRNGGVGREAALLEIIRAAEPDVVVAAEVGPPQVLGRLAAALGMEYRVARGAAWTRKVGLMSRLPVTAFRSLPLRKRGFAAELALSGQRRLLVYGVHLTAYHAWPCEWLRTREVAAVLQESRRAPSGPHLIAGDLNAIAPGDPTRLETAPLWVRAQLWPQGGRVLRKALAPLLRAGYVDCFRALHAEEDGFTLPPQDPKTRLDYVFADPTAASALRRCEVVTAPEAVRQASDHLPVLAEFDWR